MLVMFHVLPETIKKVAALLNLDMISFHLNSILDFYPIDADIQNSFDDKKMIHTIKSYQHLMKRVAKCF